MWPLSVKNNVKLAPATTSLIAFLLSGSIGLLIDIGCSCGVVGTTNSKASFLSKKKSVNSICKMA